MQLTCVHTSTNSHSLTHIPHLNTTLTSLARSINHTLTHYLNSLTCSHLCSITHSLTLTPKHAIKLNSTQNTAVDLAVPDFVGGVVFLSQIDLFKPQLNTTKGSWQGARR